MRSGRGDKDATGERIMNGGQKIFIEARFGHVTKRSFREACALESGLGVNGQEDEPASKSIFAELMSRIYSCHTGHHDVRDDHVGLKAMRFSDQITSVTHCAYDLKLGRQKRYDSFQHVDVIVRD